MIYEKVQLLVDCEMVTNIVQYFFANLGEYFVEIQ